MVKMVSSASKTQIVEKGQPLTRGKHNVSMNILLNRSDFLKLKGLVDCQIVLVKEGDPGTLGDPPKKTGKIRSTPCQLAPRLVFLIPILRSNW